jgi:ribonuclease HI
MIPLQQGIATDGAHSMKRGVTRYRAVDLATGELLFERNIGNQTINIGEFLGVVEAAKYIIEHNFTPRIIYTDSQTALTWFQEKRTASRKKNSAVKKAEVFLKVMASEIDRIKVIHWNTVDWGEIPADFNEK